MELDLFGFTIGKKKKQEPTAQDIIVPDAYDGSYLLETGGVFGTFVDFSGAIRDENQMIQHYRAMALYPEVDAAIEDISLLGQKSVPDDHRRPLPD